MRELDDPLINEDVLFVMYHSSGVNSAVVLFHDITTRCHGTI